MTENNVCRPLFAVSKNEKKTDRFELIIPEPRRKEILIAGKLNVTHNSYVSVTGRKLERKTLGDDQENEVTEEVGLKGYWGLNRR